MRVKQNKPRFDQDGDIENGENMDFLHVEAILQMMTPCLHIVTFDDKVVEDTSNTLLS